MPTAQDRHAAAARWFKQIDTFRGMLLRELAESPETRAAWELICGATDWDRVVASKLGEPTQFFIDNTNFPSTQLLLLQRVKEGSDHTMEHLLFGRTMRRPKVRARWNPSEIWRRKTCCEGAFEGGECAALRDRRVSGSAR